MTLGNKEEYFNKVLFEASLVDRKTVKILLNMQMKELCLEVSRAVRPCYSIDNVRTFQIGDTPITAQIPFPAVFMRNGKTNFNPIVVEDEDEEVVILESRAIKLSNKDIDNLIPYCLLSLFEPYVGKEMKMFDSGFVGYRDEVSLRFEATSYYHIPHMEHHMNYLYDDEHTWPSEKLYEYIFETFFYKDKKYMI